MAEPRISVVIPTYQRAEDCRVAVASALEQELPPLEVLVCDDGSTDETEALITRLSSEDPRVRYLRLRENHGSPAPARNLGIASAKGDWVGFLDSDDRWLPAKLATQSEFLADGGYDVLASNARRTSGDSYFGLHGRHEPDRREFLTHNPVIVSTAVARKSVLAAAGGFPTSALGYGIRGVEDYGLWMRLAYAGCRFLVLPDDLVVYNDAAQDRMSNSVYRQEAATAAVRWRTWLKRPLDGAVLRSAARGSVDAARWRFGRRVQ
jgi:teichuronic acid biosynthesis glycosyltransferase TuaG